MTVHINILNENLIKRDNTVEAKDDIICRVLVRLDIPTGAAAAQIAHASAHASLAFGEHFAVNPRPAVAVLGVKSEDELLKAANKLKQNGSEFVLIEETDWPIGFTAIACKPEVKNGLSRKVLSKYRLYGSKDN